MATTKKKIGADQSISAYGTARSTVEGAPLSAEELERIDAYWRASLYLSLGMLYLKDNPLSWPEIFEGGGLEGRLAVEYGITSVPTMFLADSTGKVVNRNIRTAAEAGRQVEKLLGRAQKEASGVALDQRHCPRFATRWG